MAGYSSTALVNKLVFKPGFRVRVLSAPVNYLELVSPLPEGAQLSTRLRQDLDIDHVFVTSRRALTAQLPKSLLAIRQNGMIWISWPKKNSGMVTDVNENLVRDLALPLGLVDIKVCAVDDTWSGLKLVIRKQLRK